MGLQNLKQRLNKTMPTIWETKVVDITINNLELEVHGTYTPSESSNYDYPGSPSEFQVHYVYRNNEDITELFCHNCLDEIKEMSLEEIE